MIIKGKSRAGPKALAAHLGNAEKNEQVSLLETRGVISKDLRGALVEMDAYADGTRCKNSLYHAAISPGPPHRLTADQRTEAIDLLEEKLGLTEHARIVVMHEKLGREHIHVVWSRIDIENMRAVSDSHNYRKHEEVARELERRLLTSGSKAPMQSVKASNGPSAHPREQNCGRKNARASRAKMCEPMRRKPFELAIMLMHLRAALRTRAIF